MIRIKIFGDVDDPRLKSAWDDLFARNEYCYQNSHTWCSLWLKHFRKGKRTPCIVAAEEDGRIVGIGPFMREKGRLISELKFIGSGLTDFHVILAAPERRDAAHKAILDWILNRDYYDLINLEQVSDDSALFDVLRRTEAFKSREMIKCPVINFSSLGWKDYFHGLSPALKANWSKRHRKLERTFPIQCLRVVSVPDKERFLSEIFILHTTRWEQEGGVSKFTQGSLRQFISDLVKAAPEVIIYALVSGDRLLAYDLGFDQNGVYYGWNASFDPALQAYSPGLVLTGLAIKDLIERGYKKYNMMRGDYAWKRRWMTDEGMLTNYQFLAGSSPLMGGLGERYYLSWKWGLKSVFGQLASHPIVHKTLFRARY